ncbi:hypothetical protein MMC18_006865 [Xylographa bjoerkii]|nr:hypothetical protein [Xylographa bjoerkii]
MTGFFGRSVESNATTALKNQLTRLLNEVDQSASGSFAASGVLAKTCDPQLFVDGLGSISLPLSDQDAVALRTTCQQSPVGKGSETVIDTAVRRSWELNSNRFDVRSTAWQVCVNEALERVSKELGIVGGKRRMRAELYKLLLYEEGSFFKRHRDSEKTPGMFGTLVICLPCCHTGGEVEVSFGGRQQVLKTAERFDFGYKYLAWYADVEHAVRPVTSGYRLALTYNLIFAAPGIPLSASGSAKRKLELEKHLSTRKRSSAIAGPGGPKLLAYTTEHKYTDANLQFEHLKGKDRYRAQYLKDACAGQGFSLFLVNLEYTYDRGDHHGSTVDYHRLEEITSSELKLRILVQANGVKVVEDIPVPEYCVMQRETFAGNPEEEDYSGYTGNEGVSATHFYRNSCLVVIPQIDLIDVLFEPDKKGDEDLYSWLWALLETSGDDPDDQQCKVDLIDLCEMAVHWSQVRCAEEKKQNRLVSHDGRGISDAMFGLVAEAALFLQRPELLENAASVIAECLPCSILRRIGSALTELDLSDWQRGNEAAVQSTEKIHVRYQALNALIEGYEASYSGALDREASDSEAFDNETSGSEASDSKASESEASDNDNSEPADLVHLHCFMQDSITVLLTSDCKVSREDGKALVDIAGKYGDHYMFECVLPFVKLHASNTSFSTAFLACLFQAGENGDLDTYIVSNVFADILSNILDDFKLEYQVASNKRVRYTEAPPHSHTDIVGDTLITTMAADDIVMLISYCISLENNKAVNRILRRIRRDATTINTSAFHALLIPILQGLLETLQSLGVPLVSPQFQTFFQDLLHLYILRYVGMEPDGGSDWTRPLEGCGCANCCKLNHFLADPNRQIETFAVAPAQRAHLHQRIGDSCKHETEQINGTPTLVVTKTEEPSQISLRSWLHRRDEAIQKFRDIGTREALQEILGDRYRDLRTFRAIRLSTAASTLR